MMEDNGFATGYAVGRDSTNGGGYGNNGLFGNDWAWIVILLLFGWNGRGFGGFGGGFGGGGGVGENYVLATDFATIERKLDGVNNGLCDGFYAQNTNMLNGFAAVQQTLCQGFSGINSSIANLGYQQAQCCCDVKGAIKDVAYGNAMNTNAIQQQISSCCCDLEKANMQNRFDAQAYNCNTLQAIDKVGDRIIDYLAAEKTQALRDENMALRLAASQAKQNEYLIARLGDKCPEPAYIVQPPQQVTFPTNCCGTVNYAGYNNGCGCGNF
jgi:hypothetical protein